MISCTQTSGATTPAPSNSSFTPGPWAVCPVTGLLVTTDQDEDGNVRNVALSHFFDPNEAGSKEEAKANACLIAAAPDHADIGWAMCVAAGRWEPWGDGRGEFVLNGLRFATKLDPFGVPEVTEPIRSQIRSSRGAS